MSIWFNAGQQRGAVADIGPADVERLGERGGAAEEGEVLGRWLRSPLGSIIQGLDDELKAALPLLDD